MNTTKEEQEQAKKLAKLEKEKEKKAKEMEKILDNAPKKEITYKLQTITKVERDINKGYDSVKPQGQTWTFKRVVDSNGNVVKYLDSEKNEIKAPSFEKTNITLSKEHLELLVDETSYSNVVEEDYKM